MIRTRRARKLLAVALALFVWFLMWFVLGALVGMSGVERGWQSGLAVGLIALSVPVGGIFVVWIIVLVADTLVEWIKKGDAE